MQLLPYHRFTLQTHQSLSQVIENLEAHIEVPKIVRWKFSRNHAPYEGKVSSSGFEVRRIIHYRNSFLPQIKGKFEPQSKGTLVRVTMGLHPLVMAFLLFWLATWYSISTPFFLAHLLSGDISFEVGIFLGAPIALLFVFWCVFWYEAKRSHRELTQIISGEVLEPNYSGTLSSKPLRSLAIAVIGISNAFFVYHYFLPSFQSESPIPPKSCSQDVTFSPYCNFSPLLTIEGHPTVSAIALSSDGKTLVSGGRDKAIKIWDLTTGELKRTLQSDSGVINSLAIAPDGKTVVSSSGDRMIRIWDMTSDRYPKILKDPSGEGSYLVEISADGKTIISGSYNELKFWDMATGQLKKRLPDPGSGEIKLGPVTIDNSSRLHPRTISSDSKIALVELNGKVTAWNLETNQQTVLKTKLFEDINAAQIDPDGKIAVTTSYTQPKTYLKIWDLTTGQLKAENIISSNRGYWGSSNRIALSRDRVFTSTPQGIKVWNLETAELEATLNEEQMHDLVVSPDGKLLLGLAGNDSSANTQIKVLQR
ncbi:hypothetical protein IQ249_20690 [Lusitaniella coriacea LEGE 07157]|uniref:WD40 repeat domain-containing protein n=1 Tax=Lusitaniella coriacea LEGE 07157 TaxID=945747 RepID=A0A8J7DZ76_9CYAN|nr:hypothetical protein [Lusitaniella coriacea]MBE9118314.1 hypothetical protein [Lusitaniella coriacea LEGE 07157]